MVPPINHLYMLETLWFSQGWEFAHLLIAHSLIAHSLIAQTLIAHLLIRSLSHFAQIK